MSNFALQQARNFRLDRIELYVLILAGTAISFALALLAAGFTLSSFWGVLVLALVAAVAERGSVRLSSTLEQSISLLPTLFTAVVFGPLAAMVVSGASMLGDVKGTTERPYSKWAVYSCTRAITGGVTGLVAIGAGTRASTDFGRIALATAAGALVAEALDATFAALTLWVRSVDPREMLRTLVPAIALSTPLYAPVVGVLAYVYEEVSVWALPFFVIPALAAQRLFVLYQEQRRLTDDLYSANQRLERAGLSFAGALVATLDARDEYTAGHSAAVSIYSRDIAARMGLSEDQQQLVSLAGLVHDIGKVGLPPGLLEKEGPLTLEERRLMETHSVIGENILAKVEDYDEIATIVRHHHERVDGQGYPDGLVGERIPLLSRIIAVADAYNAMTSGRPYRDAMPSRVARLRLAQAVESQFDTSVVAAFESILAGALESYRQGSRGDFQLVSSSKQAAGATTSKQAAGAFG